MLDNELGDELRASLGILQANIKAAIEENKLQQRRADLEEGYIPQFVDVAQKIAEWEATYERVISAIRRQGGVGEVGVTSPTEGRGSRPIEGAPQVRPQSGGTTPPKEGMSPLTDKLGKKIGWQPRR